MTRSTHHPGYATFLKLLRAERKKQGVTQAALAEWLGNRQTFVSKIENGERRLDVVELLEYLQGIGSDPVAFLAKLKAAVRVSHGQKDRKLALRIREPAALKK